MHEPTRRDWLERAAALLAASTCAAPGRAADPKPAAPFRFSLNTSTIRGQKLSLPQEIDIAARAGYQGIEPWIPELEAHVKGGGTLRDLRKRVEDAGLSVPDAIGFAAWIVDDDAARRKGLDEARRAMDMVQQLGGTHLAAPPVGATNQTGLSLARAAERYRTLAEIGDGMGVVPVVEMWGFSKTLGRLAEAVLVALESGHPKACVLPDVYHFYRGGSDLGGVRLLSGRAVGIFHLNDYPAKPRDTIADADRVYPGDGIAPVVPLLRDLREVGYSGFLSLELFNPTYWKQDAFQVARTGLEKMQALVQKAAG